ncbi:VOC family protein [Chelativorans salis]|uniref:VOC domain-containing protein n=1 Tax=Chelativorans salis TaxID=2978478 RepID=A0ABT2LH45_9HYPH|nr:VOC family protein [Chelativorans sp. EGI FJ00035]MCT7373748.1 hypothetical protein [Chelativorans sp. EGI FJ00035]
MSHGIKTVVYPVRDIAQAKTLYRELLGVNPHTDQAYYVGFRVGDQEIGLAPSGHETGMTAYHHVDDIEQSLKSLVAAGGQIQQEAKNVGGGRLIATVKDADDNVIGLLQDP